MSDKYYVITGNLTKETVFNLIYNINTSGFLWRGFTDRKKEMIPSSAFYGELKSGKVNVLEKSNDIQPIFIMGELQRIGYHINNENKLGKYPFEIPDELTTLIFPHTQSETDFLENMNIESYPKNRTLLQAISYVQHYHSGTSLLDFSVNPLKALYFAVGKPGETGNFENDSYLFGMAVNWFQRNKENYKFDMYLPSYYKNTRIRNQEGVFVYQLFDMKIICTGQRPEFVNILDLFENKFQADIYKGEHVAFDEMNIKDIEERSKNSNFGGIPGQIGIFYVLLKIPKEEKPFLKVCLKSLGIDENFMLGTDVH
jgi:hypothetical protein